MTSGSEMPLKGKISLGKQHYGLGLIREKLAVPQGSTIAINMLVMHLQKLLELIFALLRLSPASPQQCNEAAWRPRFAFLSTQIALA